MRRRFKLSLPLVILLAVSAAPTLAQTAPSGTRPTTTPGTSGIGWRGWGVQVGASSSPDQFYGGVHFDLGEFSKDVRFRPTVDIGVGDHVTLLTALAEVHYVFSNVQVWRPFVGGGAGFTHAAFDDHARRQGAENDTEIALMGVGGIETRLKSGTKFQVDAKVGLGDNDPDFKLGVGWSWK
jgi:hypothetical protein